MLELLITNVVGIIEAVAAVMIIISVAIGAIDMGVALARRVIATRITETRLALAERLVLSLEFLIAADILKTVIAPTLDQLAVLGGVIVIRTVLSLSIAYELRRAGAGRGGNPPLSAAARPLPHRSSAPDAS